VSHAKIAARSTGQILNIGKVSESLIWGVVPNGFAKIVDARGNRLLVRGDQAEQIDFSLCEDETAHVAEPHHYRGRGALALKKLANGETVLIRRYRHGGLFRRITRAQFFTWPPRPFQELAVTEELRRRGLRTVEVYAACVSRPLGPIYRGWLVTKQLPGAEDLWSALQSGFVEQAGVDVTLRAVAESIRSMHRQGVYHADLNLKNILVRVEVSDVASYIIDYDKAKLFLGEVPARLADRNLARLWRSAHKLDPSGKVFSAGAREALHNYYHEARRA
jgi:3-deoxy-D-manno-octulosonic acid kinase